MEVLYTLGSKSGALEDSADLAVKQLRDQLLGGVCLLVGLLRNPNPRVHLREVRL